MALWYNIYKYMNKKNSHSLTIKLGQKNLYEKVSRVLHLDFLKHQRAFWYSFFIISFLFVAVVPFGIDTVFAADEKATSIVLLEDYGTLDDDLQTAIQGGDSSLVLKEYIDMIVKIAFGLGSIGAVILIVFGGIEYITAQSFSKKSGGKDKLVRAIGALVILFSSFIVFNQLNPELLTVRFEPLTPENNIDCTDAGFACGAFGKSDSVDDQFLDDATDKGLLDPKCAETEQEKRYELVKGLEEYINDATKEAKKGNKAIFIDDFTNTDSGAWTDYSLKTTGLGNFSSYECNAIYEKTPHPEGYIDDALNNDDCVGISTYIKLMNKIKRPVNDVFVYCRDRGTYEDNTKDNSQGA